MTTPCPACSKPVDSLRSRFVGVIAGKVVAYCSPECAASGSPAVAAASAAASVSAAVLAAKGAAEPAKAEPSVLVPGPASPAVPAPPVVAATAPATNPGKGKGKKAKSPASAQTPATGVPVGPPSPAVSARGVPTSLESGPVIEIIREPASGAVVAGDEPRAKHPDEIPIAAFWSADKEKSGSIRIAGAGAVSRPEAKPAAVPARPASDAEHDELPRKSRVPLIVVLLVVLGGGSLVIYYLTKGDVAAATKLPPPEPAPAPAGQAVRAERPERAEAPAPAPIGRDAAVARARGVLEADLGATSQRVQHLAAAALARTQDAAARDVLAAQLGLAGAPGAASASAPAHPIETSDIAKLDLAYALARGGDKRGSEALAGALRSVRGEVRDEAARLLALLGDPRGVPHLLDLLDISQRRLGAAEHLAHLAEPHAVKVLQQLHDDAKTSADDKARATIALGVAGHPDVGPALHAMLDNPHFNAFAAAALAELKDAAARPVLEQQLASPALRVRAARALRRLDPGRDPAPLLPGLLDVVARSRDTEQASAAEAILLLAGPAAWSTFE